MQIPIITIEVSYSAAKVLAKAGELRHQIPISAVVTPDIEIDEPRTRATAGAETVTCLAPAPSTGVPWSAEMETFGSAP